QRLLHKHVTYNMKKLVAKENRVTELLKFGAPKSFIENIGKANELEFIIEKVDRAYEYLPQISNYSILKNLNLIPIFCRDYSFYVFAYNEQTEKIIDFNLENDEIYNDYGNNWDLLLMDIMTQYFDDEIEKGLDVEKFKSVAEKIGF